MWAAINERELLYPDQDDRPDDTLDYIPKPGLDFGFPFCHWCCPVMAWLQPAPLHAVSRIRCNVITHFPCFTGCSCSLHNHMSITRQQRNLYAWIIRRGPGNPAGFVMSVLVTGWARGMNMIEPLGQECHSWTM